MRTKANKPKRHLAKCQCDACSEERIDCKIKDLEDKVDLLKTKGSTLSAQLGLLKTGESTLSAQVDLLGAQVAVLQKKCQDLTAAACYQLCLQAMEKQVMLRDHDSSEAPSGSASKGDDSVSHVTESP